MGKQKIKNGLCAHPVHQRERSVVFLIRLIQVAINLHSIGVIHELSTSEPLQNLSCGKQQHSIIREIWMKYGKRISRRDLQK